MNSQEIRQAFLDFFAARGHAIRPSDGLIPSSDPTLLFTSAGMVPFKPLWTDAPLSFKRAASVQKCLRVGGKQSDLENVGKTLRHHSFFEMLGNFSFGDYFKKEAIDWAWEFVTSAMRLDRSRLWVSVFLNDDEAFALWRDRTGISADRIVRLGEKDNFWGPAGTSGACGPCSEIYFDLGEELGCCRPDCRPGCDCERYFEFWNLVFPQFYQESNGRRRDLPRRGIDTGMGLERLALLSQQVKSNYQTDLFRPIISAIGEISRVPYGDESMAAFHVIADHIRSLVFTISENILPSNEGRGYVVRRLLRRAVRFGRRLGLEGPFLHRLVAPVVEVMKEPYPELLESRLHVSRVIAAEEERFGGTLTLGLQMLDELVGDLKAKGKTVVPGDAVFKLSDTYGFPAELTEEVAREKGFSIDWEGFQKKLEDQKCRCRLAWKGMAEKEVLPVYHELRREVPQVEFLGYEKLAARATIAALIKDGHRVKTARAGETVDVVLDRTPFYAESGGQVGDTGTISTSRGNFEAADTVSPLAGFIVHKGKVIQGTIGEGEEAEALVDSDRWRHIQRHHTATHLLQHALRSTIGEHVCQAGSFVGPDYFHFDFTHFESIPKEMKREIESRVNALVVADDPVTIFELPLEEAKAQGALAFFGEKYGSTVRMIDVGKYSRELCGGTHARRTGEIGLFLIEKEHSIGSGLRRISAVCGEKAVRKALQERDLIEGIKDRLKTTTDQILERLDKIEERAKALENERSNLLLQQAAGDLDRLIAEAKVAGGVKLVAADLGSLEIEILRSTADALKGKMGSGIAILGSVGSKGVHLVAA
ncbi:MAG: alanine--tRNA ligase, partial [Candidatus Aureabacteria bacterium]|nr:alanine--tRNA ligase [Candidatus Auribacterota bacterium]